MNYQAVIQKNLEKMTQPNFSYEKIYWNKGTSYVIGLDEVGRGAFAGPVVTAGVIFSPFSVPIFGVNDSKLLTKRKREQLDTIIRKSCLSFALSVVSVSVINRIGIHKATQVSFRQVIRKFQNLYFNQSFYILVDGFAIPHIAHIGKNQQQAIIKGDQKSISIAAASIIAKVHRDQIMQSLHKQYSVYGFIKNKGYGTKYHQQQIKQHGLCDLHRKSFDLKKFL